MPNILGALLLTVGLFAVQLPLPGVALAQTAIASASGQQTQEVVVTGTRLKSGFTSSNPITTMTAEVLRQTTPNNIVDALNQLPDFAATAKTETPITAATGGLNGQNLLNLRDLGTNRNLVLLDGRRIVASDSADWSTTT